MGRGAGPSKLIPSGVYPLPWQGHLNLCSAGFQSGVQPRCVQRPKMTKMRSASRTTQMRAWALKRSSTPGWKSDGYPILKTVLGSKSARGKKKRRNIRRLAARKPQTQLQIILRRSLAEGEISAILALEDPALGAGLAAVAAAGTGACVGVGVAESLTFAMTETSLAGFRDYLIRRIPASPERKTIVEAR